MSDGFSWPSLNGIGVLMNSLRSLRQSRQALLNALAKLEAGQDGGLADECKVATHRRWLRETDECITQKERMCMDKVGLLLMPYIRKQCDPERNPQDYEKWEFLAAELTEYYHGHSRTMTPKNQTEG